MNEKCRQRRDFLQNLAITVLAVSAVLLFAQTQLYSLSPEASLRRFLSGSAQADGSAVSQQDLPVTAPVRVAVSGPYGRYGSITATTGEDDLLRGLLREVLGSTGTFTHCGQEEFLQSLQNTSVYYDFLTTLPLSILAETAGTDSPSEPSARYLVVSGPQDPVSLFLWDGDTSYLRCSTAVSLKSLEQTVSQYEPGSAMFAADLAEQDINATDLSPCSLFLEQTPSLSSLTSEIPAWDDSLLLADLRFNPNTKNRYTDNGTEVISESGRSLRLRPDGSVTYQSGGDGTLSIEAAGDVPTLKEAVAGVGTLLNSLLAPTAGDEVLYLQSIRQSGSLTTLTFAYHVGGVPVRFSDGSSAAEVTLDHKAVSALSLRICRYTATGTPSLLLPLRQALAIAQRHPGAELSIGYADYGAGTVEASWLAD